MNCFASDRLKQTDVKAGHFERKVQALEKDCEQWERKLEEAVESNKKYVFIELGMCWDTLADPRLMILWVG